MLYQENDQSLSKEIDVMEKMIQKDDLQKYLSNRKQLDFALKLALGSQAYLHDISSINDSSKLSFDSGDKYLSPIKSVDVSLSKKIPNNKPTQLQKQNISKLHNSRSGPKLHRQHTPDKQTTTLTIKMQLIQVWIQLIKDRCNFPQSHLSPQCFQLPSKQNINQFFNETVLRLEKLQLIQKQEYNAKLLICQLTEATLRQTELQTKIKLLENKLQEKVTIIAQQEQIILRLLHKNKYINDPLTTNTKNSPLSKLTPSQSLLKYSLTEPSQLCMIDKSAPFQDISHNQGQINKNPGQIDQNHFQSQHQQNDQQSEGFGIINKLKIQKRLSQFCESPIRMKLNHTFVPETVAGSTNQATAGRQELQTPTVKDIQKATEKNIGLKQVHQQEQSLPEQTSQDESILLSYLSSTIKYTPTHYRKPTIEHMTQLIYHNSNQSNTQTQQHTNIQTQQQENLKVQQQANLQTQQYQTPQESFLGQDSFKNMKNSSQSCMGSPLCDKASDSGMLQIREEVQRLICQNDELRLKIASLQTQIHLKPLQQISSTQSKQIQTQQIETAYGQDMQIQTQFEPVQQKCLNCHQQFNQSPQTQLNSRFCPTKNPLQVQQPNQYKIVQQNLDTFSTESLKFKIHQQADTIEGKNDDQTSVSTKICDNTLPIPSTNELICNRHENTTQYQDEKHQNAQTQTQDQSILSAKNIFSKFNKQHFASTFNQATHNKHNIKPQNFSECDHQQIQESNLLEQSPCKQQEIDCKFANTWSNESGLHAFTKQQPNEKRYSTQSSPEMKHNFLLLIENNKNLLQKLRIKQNELKQIREIIRQAKKINQEDMSKLETAINSRQARRSKQISQLKEMELKWNRDFREGRSKKTKKTQILNAQLQLKINPKIFKFIVPKTKNSNA